MGEIFIMKKKIIIQNASPQHIERKNCVLKKHNSKKISFVLLYSASTILPQNQSILSVECIAVVTTVFIETSSFFGLIIFEMAKHDKIALRFTLKLREMKSSFRK